MSKIIKNLVRLSLKQFDIGVTRYSALEKISQYTSAVRDLELILQLNNDNDNANKLLHYFTKSKSQIRQDLFVLSHLAFKRDGYFVDFGATNGIDLSNSYLMEKEFDWKGIVAEPARSWHEEIKKNRNCNIETDCVWKDSNSMLTFNECDIAEVSTIDKYSDGDHLKRYRKKGKKYTVNTISLHDLLRKYNAPKNIDYLSIDTEGSEYEILSHFDFSQYSFEVITCEHAFTDRREKICSLLTQRGYKRVMKDLSLYDDWYVKSNSLRS